MEDKTNIRLTAAEMSSLWTQYINDTASVCVLSYFIKTVEDEEIRPVIEFALNSSHTNISRSQDLFRKENFPIPIGFTDQDVDANAPRLFSDTYVLMYLRNMSILGMAANAAVLGIVTRPDVVSFHKEVLREAVKLQDVTRELMLKQGTYIRPPFISTPDQVDFVEKQRFDTNQIFTA